MTSATITPQQRFRQQTDQIFTHSNFDIIDRKQYSADFFIRDNQSYFWTVLFNSFKSNTNTTYLENIFDFLLSLDYSYLSYELERMAFNKMVDLLCYNTEDYKNNVAYIQALIFAKVLKNRKIASSYGKRILLSYRHPSRALQIIDVVKDFVPTIFKNQEEYFTLLSKKVEESVGTFKFIMELEKLGFPIDKAPLNNLALRLLSKRKFNDVNRKWLFRFFDNREIFEFLKSNYKSEYKDRLLKLVDGAYFYEIDGFELKNMKLLLELDKSIAEDLIKKYADKLYNRWTGHKFANVNRLIKAVKTFDCFSARNMLVYLSQKDRSNDIAHWINAFPELQHLGSFA